MAIDMPLAIAPDVFADHERLGLVHALPNALELASDPDGHPALNLSLHQGSGGGGIFQARWKPIRQADAVLANYSWSLAIADRAQLRLVPRTPVADVEALSQWRTIALDGEGGAIATIHLSAREAEIMRELALGDSNPISLEMELDVSGMVTGFPFTAQLRVREVRAFLSAVLGNGPIGPQEIAAAFLGLPTNIVSFQRRGSGRDPGEEALRLECAVRAIQLLFEPASSSPESYQLASDPDVDELRLRLDLPRVGQIHKRLTWSLRGFVASLTDQQHRDRHFPVRKDIRPFETVELTILNQVPLDPLHASRLRVDLEYTGRAGVAKRQTVEFRPGDQIVKRLSATWPSLVEDFNLKSKVQSFIGPLSGVGPPFPWPRSPEFVPEEDQLSSSLTLERLGLSVIEIRALRGVFDLCSGLTYRFNDGARQFVGVLSPDRERAWLVYPVDAPGPLTVEIEGHSSDASHQAVVLRNAAVNDGQVLIAPIEAMRRDPVWITCEIRSDDIPYAVIEIRERHGARVTTRIVRPGQPAQIAMWPSLFAPLSYERRTSIVRRASDGRTKPIETFEWVADTSPMIEID